jgi:hypothetical protein
VHLVEVQDENPAKRSTNWHWVILLDDGTVYDPAEDEPTHIEDYPYVRTMAAVVRVCDEA